MRKNILLLLVLTLLTSCMSRMIEPPKSPQAMTLEFLGAVNENEMAMEMKDSKTLQTVIAFDTSIENAVQKLFEWAKENFFQDGEDTVPVIIDENKAISGKGRYLIVIEFAHIRQPTMVHFEYTFEVKEGRTRFTISNPYYYVVYVDNDGIEKTDPTIQYVNEDTLRRISRGIKEEGIIEEIQNYLDGVETVEEDW